MTKKLAIFAAAVAALAFTCQGAQAGGGHRHVGKRLTAVAIGVGAASTATFFAINDWRWNGWNNSSGLTRWGAWGLTTIGCAAVSPMVATVVLKRPLTQREAGIMIGSCVIPIVGGWLVNEAYNAHPAWDTTPQPPRHWKKKHAKK
jgi:hypothetical protein